MTNRDKFNKMSNKELGFHLGNAVKYISRAGRKNPDKTLADKLSRDDIPYNVRCKLCIYRGGDCFGKSCFDGIKAWLNAPVKKIKELADRG